MPSLTDYNTLYPRDAQGDSTVLAVCLTIGCLALLSILVYVIRRVRARRAAVVPLPPVQPLAHHREQRIAQLETFSRPHSPLLARNGSEVSLTREKPGTRHTSRHDSVSPSLGTSDSAADSLEHRLLPPTPHFYSARSGSMSSGSDTGPSSPLFTPPQTPYMSHPSPVTPPPAAFMHSPRLKKQHSASSSAPSSIRGQPHRRHSQVQIVLPTPLAPELSPYIRDDQSIMSSRLSLNGDFDSSMPTSVVDQWLSLSPRSPSPSSSSVRQLRRSSSSGPRLSSTFQSANQQTFSNQTVPRRRRVSFTSSSSISQSSTASPRTVPPSSFSFVKPLPRKPSNSHSHTPAQLISQNFRSGEP